VENRFATIFSLLGVRTFVGGMVLTMWPRGFRNLLAGFLKLSDNELRVIGYVLLGTGVSVLAQQTSLRALSSKIDALAKGGRPALAGT
jgi:uncharacterized protein YjeT (DUF2065 family)